jgi:L-threonylcarbamoyladenylate synthase
VSEIGDAAAVLRRGGLVAFPTETVYGLGADAASSEAVRRLFRVKGRPVDHPVIVHIALGGLDGLAIEVPRPARALAEAFWPGPLTLVVRRRPSAIVDEVTGGRSTVAVRVPGHPVALALLEEFGGAVAAPSANRFGRVSPTTAGHVRADLGRDVDCVLDGGPCGVGVESTIVDASGVTMMIRRLGGVTAEAIENVLGEPIARSDEVGGAPGTLEHHYAPATRVELVDAAGLAARVAEAARSGERAGVIAPAPVAEASALRLGAPHDDRAYAQGLYGWLREADRLGLDVVVAVPPPATGLGAAVADRLRRAAAPAPRQEAGS